MNQMYIAPVQAHLHPLWPELSAMEGFETEVPLKESAKDPVLDLILPKGYLAVKDTQAISAVEPAL
ncbi:MAG: hypothetical protein ACI8RA_002380, partial [Chlamydiales bacterium]